MIDFTLNDLMEFSKMEEEMVREIFPQMEIDKPEPSERSVKNLLAYSKALSIRKSRTLKNVRLVLN